MIETTILFWDCECKRDYIHSKRVKYCPICHSKPDEQPDSRILEVVDLARRNEVVLSSLGTPQGVIERLNALAWNSTNEHEKADLIHQADLYVKGFIGAKTVFDWCLDLTDRRAAKQSSR